MVRNSANPQNVSQEFILFIVNAELVDFLIVNKILACLIHK